MLSAQMRGLSALAELLVVVVDIESSSVHSFDVTTVAGSVVNLNCTLGVRCSNQSVRWVKDKPNTKRETWYSGGKLHPALESSGVGVRNDLARGWSALTIPRVRFGYQGEFICYVPGIAKCVMNFHLTTTGRT